MREASSLSPAAQPGAHSRASWPELAWIPVVVVALLAVYLPGLDNSLVYDDAYLNEGMFAEYASILPVRVRMLSYGSFVWLQALFGEGWWHQRLFNVLLHIGVVAALWGLYREILRYVDAPPPDDPHAPPPEPLHHSPALGIAIGFFALNPVAVYAVGYLIQRSIVMATLFTVLALWAFMRGLRVAWPFHLLAVAFYVLAVMSKEHAVLAPLAAVPLYVIAKRPPAKRLLVLSGVGLALVAGVGALLYVRYGEILGKPFDEYSRLYLEQLARLNPDAPKHAWGLSIVNEAWLFFRYGLDWMLPWSGFMAISLRPPFPIDWFSFPQVLGIPLYASALAGGFWMLLRFRDGRALAGLSLAMAALLFGTEFATVWVQDPFSLYRSYLWAIAIPGLVFVAIHGPPVRVLAGVAFVLGGLLVWQALDRVISMATPESVWSDAIEKLNHDPRSVGRWVPYLQRGNAYVQNNQYRLAMNDFERSSQLGDLGMGAFNVGSLLAAAGRPQEALAALDRAEKQGYNLYNLAFQRGLALVAAGRIEEGYKQLQGAATTAPSPAREIALFESARAAMRLGQPDGAVAALQQLLASDPHHRDGRQLLGMAYVMKKEPQRAREVLDALIAEDPNAAAYYTRALANFALKRKAEAASDIDTAIRKGLDNPNVREWQAKIRAMP